METVTTRPPGHNLDMKISISDENVTVYTLKEIMDAMGLNPTMRDFDTLARDLSAIVHREKAWTKKYIHSVYHGNIAPSVDLTRAVETLAQTIDGAPAGVAGSVFVRLLAQPGIPEGTLLPASARAIKCACPGCAVVFIRIHPRQRYHDATCARKAKELAR